MKAIVSVIIFVFLFFIIPVIFSSFFVKLKTFFALKDQHYIFDYQNKLLKINDHIVFFNQIQDITFHFIEAKLEFEYWVLLCHDGTEYLIFCNQLTRYNLTEFFTGISIKFEGFNVLQIPERLKHFVAIANRQK